MKTTTNNAETKRQNAVIVKTLRSALARTEAALAEMQTAETDDMVRAETERAADKYRRMIFELE